MKLHHIDLHISLHESEVQSSQSECSKRLRKPFPGHTANILPSNVEVF